MSGFYPDAGLPIDPQTDLLTAQASAVDGFPAVADDTGADQPLGRTWAFDFARGTFRARGTGPAEVSDESALAVWIETVLRVGRYAYGIFSDAYGLYDAERPIGEIATPQVLADLADRMRDAILAHDRVTGVGDIVLEVQDDVILLRNMTVTYDDVNDLSLNNVQVTP